MDGLGIYNNMIRTWVIEIGVNFGHVYGCICLSTYDFLLAFYSDAIGRGGTAVELLAIGVGRTVIS